MALAPPRGAPCDPNNHKCANHQDESRDEAIPMQSGHGCAVSGDLAERSQTGEAAQDRGYCGKADDGKAGARLRIRWPSVRRLMP